MKYALGTVLGTTLLGFAKNKLGSGSSKLKPGYKHTFEGKLEFMISEEYFVTLQDSQDILDKIKNIVKYYESMSSSFEWDGFGFEEIDHFYDGENHIEHLFIIYVQKSYFTEKSNEDTTLFHFQRHFLGLLYDLEDDISPILGTCFENIHSEITTNYTSKYPYIQNQSGEWVPYEEPKKTSKLRKR